MNYSLYYDRLIERARYRKVSVYSERHHVVPVCLGGRDEKSNIVRLYPEEHFVAHQLLVKMSLASKGKKKSIEHCAAMTAARLGKKRGPHSAEHRKHLSIGIKAAFKQLGRLSHFDDPNYRQKQAEKMKQIWADRKEKKLCG